MVAKLVTEDAALTEIKKLGKDQKVRFAVAFWGNGSTKNLKIEATAEAEILCNLQSGCCDPDEIAKLMNMDRVTVLAHPSLHAKVYLSPRGALVGSSNASTNGLAMDANMTRGWREANLLVKDEKLLADLGVWFTERWAEGKRITDPMLAAAKKKWADRKRRSVIGEHFESRLTLLSSALRSPEEYNDLPIYIALSKANASKEAVKAVNSYKKRYPLPRRMHPFQMTRRNCRLTWRGGLTRNGSFSPKAGISTAPSEIAQQFGGLRRQQSHS